MLWSRRVRGSPLALFVVAMFVNVGMWLERFIIVVQSLHLGQKRNHGQIGVQSFARARMLRAAVRDRVEADAALVRVDVLADQRDFAEADPGQIGHGFWRMVPYQTTSLAAMPTPLHHRTLAGIFLLRTARPTPTPATANRETSAIWAKEKRENTVG